MRILEFIVAMDGGLPLRVAPNDRGLTIVPVDDLGATPIDLARALRQTLGQHRRVAAKQELRRVQLTIEVDGARMVVLDDQVRGTRTLFVEQRGKEPLRLEAQVGRLEDAPKLEALLVRIASAAKESVPEDLGPSLASIKPGKKNDASPKELALFRAHEKARAAAEKVRAVDRASSVNTLSLGRWVAAGAVALTSLILVAWLVGEARAIVVPIYMTVLLAAWIGYGVRTFRALSEAAKLERTRDGLRAEREAARNEEHDLAETMAKKGADPDEVIAHLRERPASTECPAILGQRDLSSAEVLELTGVGRQVIMFVDRGSMIFVADYPEVLRRFEPMANAGAPPPPPPMDLPDGEDDPE
ncbi:MAG: hypothetical protein U1E65_12520 [Myxococcota bacterium]